MSLARRNLLQNKTRLALSVTGVALSVTLILVLNGFLAGVYRQSSAYLDNTPGSVVVLQDGVKNFFLGNSMLPSGTVGSVRGEDGVSKVVPLATQFAIFELHERALSFERGDNGVRAHGEKRVEVRVALGEVRVEDTAGEGGRRHDGLVGHVAGVGLHDVPVRTIDQPLLRAQDDVVRPVREERQQPAIC